MLTNPTINVINNILITPTNTLFKRIFVLDIGNTPKYSIVLSFSSFNTILDPNSAEYIPIPSITNINPSDVYHPDYLDKSIISILNISNISGENPSNISLILFDDEIILGYKIIIIIYIIEIIPVHINNDLKLSLNSFLNNILFLLIIQHEYIF